MYIKLENKNIMPVSGVSGGKTLVSCKYLL